ncbi:MAG: DUF2273 domain-containing protein [Syntrophomonas sp.]|nr:DUF2273 domain-containing protein [Syntrophomonas sp.]
MLEKIILFVITEHRGKTIGIFMGMIASFLVINYGFWRTMFIAFCIALGYILGKKIDDKTDLEVWIKNLFKSNK